MLGIKDVAFYVVFHDVAGMLVVVKMLKTYCFHLVLEHVASVCRFTTAQRKVLLHNMFSYCFSIL